MRWAWAQPVPRSARLSRPAPNPPAGASPVSKRLRKGPVAQPSADIAYRRSLPPPAAGKKTEAAYRGRTILLSNVTMHHRPHRPDSEGAVSRQDPPTPGPAFQARSQKRPTLDKVVLAPGLRVVMPNEASPDSRPSRQEQSRVLLVPQPQADAPGGPVPLQSGTSWRRCRKISPDAVFPTTRPGKDWEPGNFRRCGK